MTLTQGPMNQDRKPKSQLLRDSFWNHQRLGMTILISERARWTCKWFKTSILKIKATKIITRRLKVQRELVNRRRPMIPRSWWINCELRTKSKLKKFSRIKLTRDMKVSKLKFLDKLVEELEVLGATTRTCVRPAWAPLSKQSPGTVTLHSRLKLNWRKATAVNTTPWSRTQSSLRSKDLSVVGWLPTTRSTTKA